MSFSNNLLCKPRYNFLGIQVLMALEYLREYRTYFHLDRSYSLSESACYLACRWVEDVLIKSGAFSLPEKKELLKSDMGYEVILIDASESPIERPKKNSERKKESRIAITGKNIFTRARRKDTLLRAK